jgi:KDO2-lipid IV(A) lauroyltransferase
MTIINFAERLAFHTSLTILRRMEPARASNFCAAVAGRLGPPLPVSKVANANLKIALPWLEDDARNLVVRAVWESLGRTMAELPHLNSLTHTPFGPGWEIAGSDILREQAGRGGPAIFFSGHIGNWEMLPVILARMGIPMSSFYRPLSNLAVDQAVNALRQRAVGFDLPMFPKGASGARGALTHLARDGYLGMLVDQKMNDGIPVEFFGRPAMTAPALAVMALRFRCPVIPGRIRRIGPARLRLEVEPPLTLPDSGDRQRDIADLMRLVNKTLEGWIADEPGAWLWLHRRWPKNSALAAEQSKSPPMRSIEI